jgi:hypothetical protein
MCIALLSMHASLEAPLAQDILKCINIKLTTKIMSVKQLSSP